MASFDEIAERMFRKYGHLPGGEADYSGWDVVVRDVAGELGMVIPSGRLKIERRNTLIWTRIDPDGPGLHKPKREGDVGWDLEAAETVDLRCGEAIDIPVNVRVQLPEHCWGEIRARSSIARRGLQVDAGVIDNGYTGPLFVLLRNVNRNDWAKPIVDWSVGVRVHKGERIGQLVLHHAYWAPGVEVEELEDDPRRGNAAFGSTGR